MPCTLPLRIEQVRNHSSWSHGLRLYGHYGPAHLHLRNIYVEAPCILLIVELERLVRKEYSRLSLAHLSLQGSRSCQVRIQLTLNIQVHTLQIVIYEGPMILRISNLSCHRILFCQSLLHFRPHLDFHSIQFNSGLFASLRD